LIERWFAAVPRVAKSLDTAYSKTGPTEDCDLADLTAAVAFEYVDFRLPGIGWQAIAPRFAERVGSLGR
jgi:hypothetical protein